MRRRTLMLAAVGAALAACSREQAQAPAEVAPAIPDPAAVIAPLYGPYLAQGGTFPSFRDQAPWSADLWAQLEAMSARSQALNEPILDFDPLIGAQDHDLSNLRVTAEALVENSHALVRADFTNLGREEAIVYDLVWEGGGWRVNNIRGRDWDLRQIATQAAPTAP